MSLTQFERNHNFVASSTDKNITGTRFVANPSIAVPFETSYGYVKPKLTMNIRSYELEGGSTNSKSMTIPTLSVDSGVYLDKKITSQVKTLFKPWSQEFFILILHTKIKKSYLCLTLL